MRQNDFENAPMIKLVMGLAIPSMIAQLVNILYSIVDRMFVGQIEEVGNLCLAAVGICGPIVTLLSSFGTLVGIGGSVGYRCVWVKRMRKGPVKSYITVL